MKNILNRSTAKIKEVGIKNAMIGLFKMVGYLFLQKKYHFDQWHLSPYEWRKYPQDVANYISSQSPLLVVDLGCGLGGLLAHIKAGERVGYDINREPIRAANYLYRHKRNLEFYPGTFPDII